MSPLFLILSLPVCTVSYIQRMDFLSSQHLRRKLVQFVGPSHQKETVNAPKSPS
jgi:hypothetical protein